MVAAAVLLASCGGETITAAGIDASGIDASGIDASGIDASGDGRLDCDDGQIAQGAGIEVFAATEEEVAALALERWTSAGAALVALPPDESWSAVIDGRDVAIAYPERNGDGRWTVHAVSTCGPPKTGPAPIDGQLDCANDAGWGQTGSIDPTVPGLPTADEAVLAIIEPFADRHGGELVVIGEGVTSLVVDGREQVVVTAVEVDAGGWVVTSVSGCQGFER